jgi:putative transcriptional regulator
MITHHPNDITLTEFVAGRLDEGRSLVAAEHLARCPQCQRFVSSMEHIGGKMLEQVGPVAMAADARDKAFARIDRPVASELLRPTNRASLSDYPLGNWRWIAPGLRLRSVAIPARTETRVFLLKAAPGIKLPQHTHTGTEMTCVLQGAFIHEGGRYAAGDCDDADQDDEHSPVVDTGEECICLVAMQGTIKLGGMFGPLLQPFIRL